MEVQSTACSANFTLKDNGEKAVITISCKRGTYRSYKSLLWSRYAPGEVTVEKAGVTKANGIYKQCFIADKYSKKGL